MHEHHHHGAHAPGLAVPQRARAHPVGLESLGAGAAAPAGLTASEKDKGPGAGSAEAFKGQEPNGMDCAQTAPGMQADAERKEVARVTALAAFAGCALHELAGGGYLLCRWNLSRELPDLRAVVALLRRMGAQA